MKRIQFLPNLITAFGLVCGLFVVFKIAMFTGGATGYSVMRAGAMVLLVAAMADLLDGAIARFLKAESAFGTIFDSLSDAITFGVAPSVMMLKSLDLESPSHMAFFATLAAMTYSLCGVLRLVRYNVTGSLGARGTPLKGDAVWCRTFTGLPIPAAAAASVSATLFLLSPQGQSLFRLSEPISAIISITTMFLLGYLMVSRWRFPGLRSLHFRVRAIQLVVITAVVVVVLFYGVLYFFPLLFITVAWGYVLIAWSLSLVRLILGKRAKVLDAFEPLPDPDDEDDEENEEKKK
jgi:CDP-diacylglycerol---serine O-phosphatidyltransferase